MSVASSEPALSSRLAIGFNEGTTMFIVCIGVVCFLPAMLELDFREWDDSWSFSGDRVRTVESANYAILALSLYMMYDALSDILCLELSWALSSTRFLMLLGIAVCSILYAAIDLSGEKRLVLLVCMYYARMACLAAPFMSHISAKNNKSGFAVVTCLVFSMSGLLFCFLFNPFLKVPPAVTIVFFCLLLLSALNLLTYAIGNRRPVGCETSQHDISGQYILYFGLGWVCYVSATFIVSASFKQRGWGSTSSTEHVAYFVVDMMTMSLIHTVPTKIANMDYSVQKRKEQAKKLFVRYVSHELRTPLTVVTLALQMLADKSKSSDSEFIGGVAQDAQGACNEAVAILDNLLIFDQIDDGSLRLNANPVPMDLFIQKAVSMFGVQGRVAGVSFQCEPLKIVWPEASDTSADVEAYGSSEVVCAVIDRKKLTLALRNVVGNAIKFTSEGGSVRVRPTYHVQTQVDAMTMSNDNVTSTGLLRIEVQDTGIGVPLNRQQTIFTEGGDMNIDGGGNGMGLWLADAVMQRHNGRIGVVSEGVPGLGSTFFLELDAYSVKDDGRNFALSTPDIEARSEIEMSTARIATDYDREKSNAYRMHESERQDPASGVDKVRSVAWREGSVSTPIDAADVSRILSTDNDRKEIVESIERNTSQAKSASNANTTETAAVVSEKQKLHVAIVVDDSALSRKMIRKVIKDKFVDILEAQDGVVAVDKVTQSFKDRGCYPDVIFLDHQMPNMTGLQVVEKLRSQGCNSAIFMVTGHALKDDVDKFLKAGADQVLTKPFDPTRVLSMIDNYSSSKKIDPPNAL